jgi:hypothetical protein
MPLLVFEGIRLSYGAYLLLCGLGVGGKFSLLAARFAACKSQHAALSPMKDYQVLIVYLFLIATLASWWNAFWPTKGMHFSSL